MSAIHPYHNTYLDFGGVPGRGTVPAKYMVIAVAPSPRRPRHLRHEPFGSSSYRIVQQLIDHHPQVYMTNLVKEPTSSRTRFTKAVVEPWLPALFEEIRVVRPERILTLGPEPSKVLCPGFKEMQSSHGTFFWNPEIEAWVIPTFHFAAASRRRELWPWVIRDLERLMTLPPPKPPQFEIIKNFEHFAWREHGLVCLDLETEGLDHGSKITMVGLKDATQPDPIEKNYILLEPTPDQLRHLGRLFRMNKSEVLGHNLVFDLNLLLTHTNGEFPDLIAHDTMLCAHIGGHPRVSLKHLTAFLTDLPGSHSAGSFQDPAYLAEDLRSTAALYPLVRSDAYAADLVQDLVPVIARMRQRGVYVDRGILESIRVDVKEEVANLGDRLQSMASGEVNWRSPSQVAAFLLENDVPLKERTDSGNYSVSKVVLTKLLEEHGEEAYPVLTMLIRHRGLEKVVTGFLDPYLAYLEYDGLLHPRLLLHGTVTGRLACRDPSLQQVPRVGPIKTAFTSRWEGGKICLVDLSQAELRIAAYLSGDKALGQTFLGRDVHREIASMLFGRPMEDITSGQRKFSKKITFGVLYGGSVRGLAYRSGFEPNEVAAVLEVFNEEFPQLSAWLRAQREAVEFDASIATLFGRRRDLSAELNERGASDAARKAINTPIQSLASDLMLVVLREIEQQVLERDLNSYPLFGVHDSLILEVYPGEEEELLEVVQLGFEAIAETPLRDLEMFKTVPIIGEAAIGESWAAVEETNEGYGAEVTRECFSHKP